MSKSIPGCRGPAHGRARWRRGVIGIAASVVVLASMGWAAPAPPPLRLGIIASLTASNLVEDLKACQANTLFFFNPLGNALQTRAVIAACRREGLAVMTEQSPRGPKFIFTDEKKVKRLRQPACLNGPFADQWATNLAETAGQLDLDSFGLCPDEFYWSNAQMGYTFGVKPATNLPFYCDCAACRQAFRSVAGREWPASGRSRLLTGDSQAERDFVKFRYQSAAQAFQKWAQAVTRARPGQRTALVFSAVPVYALERYPGGICWDLIGSAVPVDDVVVTAFPGCWDYRGPETHFWITETAKHLVGAFPRAASGVVINLYDCNVDGESNSVRRQIDGAYPAIRVRPVDIYGTLLSCVANDARIFLCFAQTYVQGAKRTAVTRGFKLVKSFERQIADSVLPLQVVVLYSRSGEDFYALAHTPRGLDAVADRTEGIFECGGWAQPANREAFRFNSETNQAGSLGFRVQKELVHTLLRAGITFRLHYLDQLTADNLSRAQLIILPFPHAISVPALELLKKRSAEGARILWMNCTGELDENGHSRANPAVSGLMGLAAPPTRKTTATPGRGRVVYLPLAERSNASDEIAKLLEDQIPPVPRKLQGDNVEVVERVLADGSRLLFMINWADAAVHVALDAAVQPGDYRVTGRDLEAEAVIRSPAAERWTERQLRSLELDLKPYAAQIMLLQRLPDTIAR